MIAGKTTRAGLAVWIAALVATGLAGATVAGETARRTDSSPGAKPAVRLAFNAKDHLPWQDFRLPAEFPAGGDTSAIAALRQAATGGDSHAALELGLCYESGRGVARDPVQAIAWYRRAADRGLDEAQYKLGCCYNGDEGFPKDAVEAAQWWERAAAQGHADAQYCLGLSYSMGAGVAKNPVEAAQWWMKAAEQNHAGAQYFLGLSFSAGLGVQKIQEQAIYWLRQAALNGNEGAIAALKKLGQNFDRPPGKRSARRRHPGAGGRSA